VYLDLKSYAHQRQSSLSCYDGTVRDVLKFSLAQRNNQNKTNAGLLTLKNPRSELRPTASDVVLLTVRDVKHPETVLAGAKLPVSRIRFPLRFKLSTSNLVSAKEAAIWKESASQHDLLVQAVVCSSQSLTSSKSTTCSNSSFQAQGVAKLLRLSDNDVTIRSAVSLPLSFINADSD
jgi:hypothetical protein